VCPKAVQQLMYREKYIQASAQRLCSDLPALKHIKLAASKEIFCKVLKTQLIKLSYPVFKISINQHIFV